jgi:hypothetical protein
VNDSRQKEPRERQSDQTCGNDARRVAANIAKLPVLVGAKEESGPGGFTGTLSLSRTRPFIG